MSKKVTVIGSGFSSLSASCYLAKQGYEVLLFEKLATVGGRARQYVKDGFTFDMGPSWYWMPGIFERFFADFGKLPSDYYTLDKLNPAYKIFFKDEVLTIGDSMEAICTEFERIEPGSSGPLKAFIEKARRNYEVAINDIVYRPGLSPLELVTPDTIAGLGQFFRTISGEVRRSFKNPKLLAVLEFPVLFLGAKPSDTPAFYSFMNYADFGLGTWHPQGGMYRIVAGMKQLAESLGVVIATDSAVDKILIRDGAATGIAVNGREVHSDFVLSGADYHHTETLLGQQHRQFSDAYWAKKTFAPSCLLFYVGFDKKLEGVSHHNLFFDTDFNRHAKAIYDIPCWPEEPLFYANFPSVTDTEMAPEGCETGFFLIPLAPDLEDSPELRAQYFDIIVERFRQRTGQDLRGHIRFSESFCVNDFKQEYNSYKGNAYGLANTLRQTAFLRPGLKSKKVKNLYFTGQLTVPGPGVPPALISGKLVSELIIKCN
jgi:phytoene desaturase